MAGEVQKADPNVCQKDLLYSLLLAVGGTMIVQLPGPLRSYTERDLIYSLLLYFETNGFSGGSGGSGTSFEWTSGAVAPDNGDGANGDWYLDDVLKILYKKEAGAWAVKGTMAKRVEDDEVVFQTPTAGEGKAPINTP